MMIAPDVDAAGLYQIALRARENPDPGLVRAVEEHPNVYPALSAWAVVVRAGGEATPPPPPVQAEPDGEEEFLGQFAGEATPVPVKRRNIKTIVAIIVAVCGLIGIVAASVLMVTARTRPGPASPTISTGSSHQAALGLTASGDGFTCTGVGEKITCYGMNTLGQLGMIDKPGEHVGTITAPAVVTMLVAGKDHACYSTGMGVACWGANQWRQAADTASEKVTPSPIEVLKTVKITSLTAGDIHTCATTDGGEVWCWGSDWTGQVTAGGKQGVKGSAPVKVNLPPTLGPATRVTASRFSTCVWAGEKLACWGANHDHRISTAGGAIVGVSVMNPDPSTPPVSPTPPGVAHHG